MRVLSFLHPVRSSERRIARARHEAAIFEPLQIMSRITRKPRNQGAWEKPKMKLF
jgi:hypothetical protein